MTKAQELAALSHLITTLPQDSYLRPWLEDVLPQVEAEIRSDFPVSPSLSRTRQDCLEREKQCNDLCRDARERTRKECDELAERARQDRMRSHSNLITTVRASLYELEHA